MPTSFPRHCARVVDDGRLLPRSIRERLGRGLGADLFAVRVHTGPASDRWCRLLGTEAFTCGSHLFFRDGAYRPDTTAGYRILAHEVAHAVQQAQGAAPIAGTLAAAAWERDAERCAASLAAGRDVASPTAAPIVIADGLSPVIQRHDSFEHRALGDMTTSDLVAISQHGPKRDAILKQQIALCELWADKPERVSEADVKRWCPWIHTLRLGPDAVLATYGEVNALPDYLANAPAIDALPQGVLVPVLQVIRQEGYNRLTTLLTGKDSCRSFAQSACAPWPPSLVSKMFETMGLDQATRGLGVRGENHYQGLLARNACHFAPFSWYRWQASHLIARDLAKKAHEAHDSALEMRARLYHGYADHFLQDSFAAGHLVNKTLLMQWFIEWAATQTCQPEDWDAIKDMTVAFQPDLAGRNLYNPYLGGSNDPQTAQEAPTLESRAKASGLRLGDDPLSQYQKYLAFLVSVATQLASAALHDRYNSESLWVGSEAHPDPYEVWGDSTLLSGDKGDQGVQETSSAAQMSQEALVDILNTGQTSISVDSIRRHFPTLAASAQDKLHLLQPLGMWNEKQHDIALQFFTSDGSWKTYLAKLTSPRLGIVSQDQRFAQVWYQSAESAGYEQVDTLIHQKRLFIGSNGYVYELDRTSGCLLHKLKLPEAAGDTRLATDGTTLFAGVQGRVHGVRLSDFTKQWTTPVDASGRVNILWNLGSLYAGCCDGCVHQIDPATGKWLNYVSISDHGETRIAPTDENLFFAGCGSTASALDRQLNIRWTTRVDSGDHPVSVVWNRNHWGKRRMFAGANGWVYEIDPDNGNQLHQLLLTSFIGAGDYDTCLATYGTELYVGVHGWVYGVKLTQPEKQCIFTLRWQTGLENLPRSAVNVQLSPLPTLCRIFAGCNGYIYELNLDGRLQHSLLLTSGVGVGDYHTQLAADDNDLFVGVHGYEYKVFPNKREFGGNLDN